MTGTELSALLSLFEQIHAALQRRVARTADTALVVRNWLFGYYLVVYEGAGAERAEIYGKALIETMAASLAARGIRGMSATNLRKCRAFYENYRDALEPAAAQRVVAVLPQLRQALPVESAKERLTGRQLAFAAPSAEEPLIASLSAGLLLGWTDRPLIEALLIRLAARLLAAEARRQSRRRWR